MALTQKAAVYLAIFVLILFIVVLIVTTRTETFANQIKPLFR